MVGVDGVFRRHALEQLLFHFQRCFSGGQTGAVADAEDVRVHRHGRLTKTDIEHHIGRLAAHAGQGFQRFARAGYFTVELLHQNAAGLHQVLGLAAVQANGLDVALQSFQPQVQNGLRGVGNRKEFARGFVHPHVRGLGRQQYGCEQLKVAAVLQFGARLGVGFAQGGEEMFDIVFFHRVCNG